MANLPAEEPDALMRARPGLWEPWRVTARATQPDARSQPCELTAHYESELPAGIGHEGPSGPATDRPIVYVSNMAAAGVGHIDLPVDDTIAYYEPGANNLPGEAL